MAALETPGEKNPKQNISVKTGATSSCSPAAHLQESDPGVYCDMRECSSGMRRRSTHLFSQRSPGDVGQEEQDSVSWGDAANRFKNSVQQPPSRSRRERDLRGER